MSITRTLLSDGSYGPPKSKKGTRNVPLSKGTLKVVNKLKIWQAKEKLLHGRDWNPGSLLFCRENGTQLPDHEARDEWERIVAHIKGIPYLPPHRLRHSHITMLLKAGLPASSVAERVGDTTATIEKDYAHVLQSMRDQVVQVIEQEFEELP
jgi:integrase